MRIHMTAAKSRTSGVRSRLLRAAKGWGQRYVDATALVLILVLTMISTRKLLLGGTIVGMDTVTQYYTWYSYLGESLRSGAMPGWNPRQFSGVPFAGDPLSGWTYLPAMVLFTLLPLNVAAKAYLFLHLLLAGLFTYSLARVLRMGTAGALLAAVAYEYSGYLFVRNTCCFPYANVYTWLPLAILGAELAIRSPRLLDRGLWWGLSGLALSQILAAWLGQGSYYALLAVGGYVAYRTLLFPPENMRSLRGRLSGIVVHGGAVLLFGFGLAAAGILPRLEYNALSNLAGGYSNPKTGLGWSIEDWDRLFLPSGQLYAGAAVLALALAAPLVARGSATRFAVPYFAALSLFALTFAGRGTTLLHSVLYLLPGLERMHPHAPPRVMLIFYLGIAILAGATLTCLGEEGRRSPVLISLPILAALFLLTRSTLVPPVKIPENRADADLWEAPAPYLLRVGVQMHPGAFWALIIAVVLAAAYALLPVRLTVPRALAAALLVLVVFVDLYAAGMTAIEHRATFVGGDKIVKLDLAEYYEPTGATRFLQSEGEEPSRYVSFDPQVSSKGNTVPYNVRFTDPESRALEAENRATLWEGLQSVQGYNAVHLARYGEYLRALNVLPQNYHGANVLPEGIESQLLDLLNVRHIVVPADITAESPESLQELERELPVVYEDDTVKILENREALPRAWIVHSARQTEPEEALFQLAFDGVDPRKTALLEEAPPDLAEPDNASDDRASVTGYEAGRVGLETSTGAGGLLVLSEVYYPAWKAYVDGERVPLYRADHLLRAVPVPAGEHTVELRYESWTLRLGTVVSLLTGLILAALMLLKMRDRRTCPKSLVAGEHR
jgi:hypothetical protein